MPSLPDNTETAMPVGWRWAPAWVLAFVALWPAPGYAEAVMVLGALAAIARLLLARFRDAPRLLSGPAWALTSVLFCSYWLPELVSAFDALDHGRAFREALVDLRCLPFLWLVAAAVGDARGRRITFGGIGIIVAIWTVDALLQALSGTSPLFAGMDAIKQAISGHGVCTAAQVELADRLGGVLGPCNLKLGVVLASLAPFALYAAGRRFGAFGWLVAAAGLGLVVLLAGARPGRLPLRLGVLLSRRGGAGWEGVAGVVAVRPSAAAPARTGNTPGTPSTPGPPQPENSSTSP